MKALFAQKALYSASPILPQAAFPALGGAAAKNPTGRVGIGCLGDQRLVLEGRHELDGMSPIFSCAKRHFATVKDRKSQY